MANRVSMVGGRAIGKREPRFDVRTLNFAKYSLALPEPPALSSWVQRVSGWPMMGNDNIGDCTCAAAGHMIQQWTAYGQGREFVPGDSAIVKAYSDVSGYIAGDPSSDSGAYMLDVLRYWRRNGIAGHRVGAYAALKVGDWKELKQAVMLFGNAYIGLNLPIGMAEENTIWHVPDGGIYGILGRPGSWGGHCVPVVAYDDNCFVVVTWGGLFLMSYNFYLDYCDEAYAVLSPDWIDANGNGASGFDVGTLKSDLVALAA